MKKKSELSHLKNIGPTIEKRLNEINIYTRLDLNRIGPVKAYKWICRNYPDKTIPVCYYLYSLEGALRGQHWDALSPRIKEKLLSQVSPNKRLQRTPASGRR